MTDEYDEIDDFLRRREAEVNNGLRPLSSPTGSISEKEKAKIAAAGTAWHGDRPKASPYRGLTRQQHVQYDGPKKPGKPAPSPRSKKKKKKNQKHHRKPSWHINAPNKCSPKPKPTCGDPGGWDEILGL